MERMKEKDRKKDRGERERNRYEKETDRQNLLSDLATICLGFDWSGGGVDRTQNV